jgi:CHAT domain-containing protein
VRLKDLGQYSDAVRPPEGLRANVPNSPKRITIRLLTVILLAVIGGCDRMPIRSNEALYKSAQLALQSGDKKKALDQAKSGFRKCGSSAEWCWKFKLLNAEIDGQSALDLLADGGEPPNIELKARRRMIEGWAVQHNSEPERALALLGEAHRLAETSGSSLLVAEVESRQGPVLQDLGRLEEAEATLRHALSLTTQENDLYLQVLVMGNLGYLFHEGYFDYNQAVYWFEKTLAVSKRIGATRISDYTIGNLGSLYRALGDLDQALASLAEGETLSARAGDRRSQGFFLGDSSNIFLDRQDFSEAILRSKRALDIGKETGDKKLKSLSLATLAQAFIGIGNLDAAEAYNQEGQELAKNAVPAQEPYFQLNFARIAGQRKQFEQAEELYRSLLDRPSDDPTPALEAQAGLAELYIETHQPEKADAQFKAAIKIIEGRQAGLKKQEYKLTYLASLVRFYRGYVDFLIQSGDTDRALQVVESSRARILTERVTNAAVARNVSKARLQELARSSNRILLSYWLGPKQSYVWIISPAKTDKFNLPSEKIIAALVEKYRAAIDGLKDTVKSQNPAGAELSRILLDPIRSFTPPGSRVVIVPDGSLHSLNFGTLPAPEDPSKYWIEDVTITVAPSLGLLINSSPVMSPRSASLLAIGDAESPGEDFAPLMNSRREVDSIAALFPAPSRTVFEGAESRPSKYSSAGPANFSFIHFAVHATANRASPLDSSLILTREGNKYALTAREISNIPVNASLVTLSACRSAGARAYSGEGLVGLTWAFLQAGAHNVIAGLWDVDDASTSLLMSQMYADLARNATPEDALRTAQLGLLSRSDAYKKPYYWGPFQLYSRVATAPR